VIAIVGGLVAAICWAASSLCARRSSRVVGPYAAVAWVMLIGLVPLAPLALLTGTPERLDGSSTAWACVGGLGAVVGLVAMYAAFRVGKVGVVAPIIAAEGAIAAVVAIAFGERLGVPAGLVLVVIVVGIVLTSVALDVDAPARTSAGAPVAILAACCFGASLYGIGRAGDDLGAVWTLLVIRLVAVVALVLPLLVVRRLRWHAAAAPFLLASGALEIAGGAAFIVGAGDGIAITSVVASQNATFIVAAGFVFLGERLGRVQAIGVGVVLVGVTVLAGLQA
jgi:drug/metabolite transporter (DMT)-like permease